MLQEYDPLPVDSARKARKSLFIYLLVDCKKISPRLLRSSFAAPSAFFDPVKYFWKLTQRSEIITHRTRNLLCALAPPVKSFETETEGYRSVCLVGPKILKEVINHRWR